MKSINHVYEQLFDEEIRKYAVIQVSNKNRKSREFQKYAENFELAFNKSYDWIADYKNDKHISITIYDGINRKKRIIIVPTFKELVVQHCVVKVLKPMFFKGMYRHSYAAVPARQVFSGLYDTNHQKIYFTDKRGAYAGKKYIERWIRKDPKNCKYVLKMDIKHFFDSIPHDILLNKLKKSIHDEKMIKLLEEIINVTGTDRGIPLGFYTSQWFSNWYLQGLDHYIKEQLHAVFYMRYMDDMVIFGSNKRNLHKMRIAISEYLETELGLELKSNWQVFRFDYVKKGKHYGRDLDFMGFRFYRDRTVMRKSIMIKCSRKANRISKKGNDYTSYDTKQMMSYLGYLNSTDTYDMYIKWIKPKVSFGDLKRKISRVDRRNNKLKNINIINNIPNNKN